MYRVTYISRIGGKASTKRFPNYRAAAKVFNTLDTTGQYILYAALMTGNDGNVTVLRQIVDGKMRFEAVDGLHRE